MEYLGQTIELIQQDTGWISIWHQPGYVIQIGFFQTPSAAWDAAVELIQRELAVRALLNTLDEWATTDLISYQEHAMLESELVKFVAAV
jgi:hypothetical protein